MRFYDGKIVDVQNVSVCIYRRKCFGCMKLLVGFKEQKEYRCGYIECRFCYKYVEVAIYKCFIQVVKFSKEEKEEKKEKKKKKVKCGVVAGLVILEVNDEGMDIEDDDKLLFYVFFDIEVMQDIGRYVFNLLIVETENDDRSERFRGEYCVRDFFEWFDILIENDIRFVIVIVYNF